MFAAAIGGWLRILVEGVQTQLVPQLFEVNGWATDRLPKVIHSDIETPDLAKIGDYIVKLYSAGMDWDFAGDATLADHLRLIANLPRRAEGAVTRSTGQRAGTRSPRQRAGKEDAA
jgi:hypothetical protein